MNDFLEESFLIRIIYMLNVTCKLLTWVYIISEIFMSTERGLVEQCSNSRRRTVFT